MKAEIFYNLQADQYNLEHNKIFYEKIAEKLIEKIDKNLNPKKILEIGAGTGFSTKIISKKFPDSMITALEPSSPMLELGKKTNQNVNWINDSLSTFHIEENYDLIICSMSAHWFSEHEWQKLLKLNKHSYFAFALPAIDGNDTDKNSANLFLRKTLFKVKTKQSWNRKIRSAKNIKNYLNKELDFEITKFYLDEFFINENELCQYLYQRGIFLALFRDEATTAKYLLQEQLKNEERNGFRFSWTFNLLTAKPNGDFPSL